MPHTRLHPASVHRFSTVYRAALCAARVLAAGQEMTQAQPQPPRTCSAVFTPHPTPASAVSTESREAKGSGTHTTNALGCDVPPQQKPGSFRPLSLGESDRFPVTVLSSTAGPADPIKSPSVSAHACRSSHMCPRAQSPPARSCPPCPHPLW